MCYASLMFLKRILDKEGIDLLKCEQEETDLAYDAFSLRHVYNISLNDSSIKNISYTIEEIDNLHAMCTVCVFSVFAMYFELTNNVY